MPPPVLQSSWDTGARVVDTPGEDDNTTMIDKKYVRVRKSLMINKTKYFRLRLSDEVGTERRETDLRLT